MTFLKCRPWAAFTLISALLLPSALNAQPVNLSDAERKQVRQSLSDLLQKSQYDELSEALSKAEQSFKDREISDEALLDFYWTFCDYNSSLNNRFDGWISRQPGSYISYLARAIHHNCLGGQARGRKFSRDTPPENFRQMESHLNITIADLHKAISLNGDALIAYYFLVGTLNYFSDSEKDARLALDESIRVMPDNFTVRRAYMHSIDSKWGGSTELMEKFLAECRRAQLSTEQLGVLEASVLEDQAWVASEDGDYRAESDAYSQLFKLLTPAVIKEYGYRVYLGTVQRALKSSKTAKDLPQTISITSTAIQNVAERDAAFLYSNRGWANFATGNKKPAFEDYMHAASLGDSFAQNAAGAMLFLGDGVPVDKPRALPLFEAAAKSGNKDAETNLYWARRKQ